VVDKAEHQVPGHTWSGLPAPILPKEAAQPDGHVALANLVGKDSEHGDKDHRHGKKQEIHSDLES
jgi:hypothetical protein